MHSPKVMVCVPTYAKSAPVAPHLLNGLASQTYKDTTFVFLDTSAASGTAYAQLPELIKRLQHETTILRTHTKVGASPHQIVAEAREQLRQHFLKSDADYLFFVDDDIELPPDALEKLLGHEHPAAVGVYLNPMVLREGHDPEVAVCAWVRVPGHQEGVVRPLSVVDVLPARIMPVALSGLGCALLHRDIMDIPFAFDPASTTTEDTPFFIALGKRGVMVLCDTRVKCMHWKFPLEDPRNKRLDFNRYKVVFDG